MLHIYHVTCQDKSLNSLKYALLINVRVVLLSIVVTAANIPNTPVTYFPNSNPVRWISLRKSGPKSPELVFMIKGGLDFTVFYFLSQHLNQYTKLCLLDMGNSTFTISVI